MSGGGAAHGLSVPTDLVQMTQGAPAAYAKLSDAGNRVTRFFCETCGTQLFLRSAVAGPHHGERRRAGRRHALRATRPCVGAQRATLAPAGGGSVAAVVGRGVEWPTRQSDRSCLSRRQWRNRGQDCGCAAYLAPASGRRVLGWVHSRRPCALARSRRRVVQADPEQRWRSGRGGEGAARIAQRQIADTDFEALVAPALRLSSTSTSHSTTEDQSSRPPMCFWA
ncbi:MAG: GFA family protein [Methylobacteriaceae bacterium]|nr:GFA family protein [Methylobacteriaceae bacterium]